MLGTIRMNLAKNENQMAGAFSRSYVTIMPPIFLGTLGTSKLRHFRGIYVTAHMHTIESSRRCQKQRRYLVTRHEPQGSSVKEVPLFVGRSVQPECGLIDGFKFEFSRTAMSKCWKNEHLSLMLRWLTCKTILCKQFSKRDSRDLPDTITDPAREENKRIIWLALFMMKMRDFILLGSTSKEW